MPKFAAFLLLSVISLFGQTDTTKIDTSKYFMHNFTYAGERRYLIDGSQPEAETNIRTTPAILVGSAYVGTLIALHINQSNAWWKDQRSSFHFQEDWISALQVDKFGHAFGGYSMSYLSSQGLLASGFSPKDADFYGMLMGMAYQTYVEIEDGFGGEWGFSPSDWYFDVFGAGFYYAQTRVPFLQNFTPKWQFIPSEWTNKPKIERPRTFIDDYNSSTFWLSIDVYNMLPLSAKKWYPKWLSLAIGYGGDAIDVRKDPTGPPDQLSVRRYIIGLDYNLVRLLPEGCGFWNWFRQTLNFIKLPAPAIEFNSAGRTKFYLLYPFQINLNGLKF